MEPYDNGVIVVGNLRPKEVPALIWRENIEKS
jgi:hypothetical protein